MLELGRRGLVLCGTAAGLTLCASGCGAGDGPAGNATGRPTTAGPTTHGSVDATPLAHADDVRGTPLPVEPPGTGGSAFLVRVSGHILMLSATCTHAGCTVAWQASRREIVCPCHTGTYDASGAVVSGPPPAPLERLPVQLRDGQVYAAGR
jgi:Rieske Fe-S protein